MPVKNKNTPNGGNVAKSGETPVIETILGNVPAKSNRYKVGKGKLYRDASVCSYESSFAIQCRHYKNKGIDYRFEFGMIVYFKSKASDLDNAAKTVLDCLQKCNAVTNDNLCSIIKLEKRVDVMNPRIEYYIKAV